MSAQYLGDGVYVETDGYALVVHTHNGIRRTAEITLELDVWLALQRFVKAHFERGPAVPAAAADPDAFPEEST